MMKQTTGHVGSDAAFQRELAKQIEEFGYAAKVYGGYAQEYLDYLMGLRDKTFPVNDSEHVAMSEVHDIIDSQEAADRAWRDLALNVRGLYLRKIRLNTLYFKKAGERGGPNGLSRYELVSTDGLANALTIFNPEILRDFISRRVFPLVRLQNYGYYKKVMFLLREIESAWDAFFKALIVAVPGEMEFVAAKSTYGKLIAELEGQFGIIGSYKPYTERKVLFETFKTQLDALSACVFACDSKRLPNFANVASKLADAATLLHQKRSVTLGAKVSGLSPKGQYPLEQRSVTFSGEDTVSSGKRQGGLNVSPRLRKDFIKNVDFDAQVIEFKKAEPISKRKSMTIKKTKQNRLWDLLVRLITQREDDGWVTLGKSERNWHGNFRRTARGDKTRSIVDPRQDAVILGYHVFADKPAGESGPTKIRLEARYDEGKYKTCMDKFKTWYSSRWKMS